MPLPKVKGMSEAEVFKVVKSGKTKSKEVIKVLSSFVSDNFNITEPIEL